MKTLLLLCCCLFLTGCGPREPVWETVEDIQPVYAVANWQEEAYSISLSLPEEAALLTEWEGGRTYGIGEDYRIETSVFLTSCLDSAVRQLSGFDAHGLTIVETERFDLPEYHFAWFDGSGKGHLCQADLVLDGETCYAVVCSRTEASGAAGDEMTRAVFSSFGLYRDEGV